MLTGRQGRRSGTGELNPAVIGLFAVDRLRKELESRGLNSTGNKSALEERLLEAIKSGKTVFSPDASVSTAAVAIKAEIIETEETPPARKRGRKRKAQDVPLEPEESETTPTPSAPPTPSDPPVEECKKIVRKSLQLGGKSKLNWATRPPVEALQKAFDPLGDTAAPDTKPPVEALQKAFDPSGDTASPDTKPPLMNETAPSIPPPQLPKPTQPPPIKAQRETISPDVKVLSVSGKVPSTIRPPPKPAHSAKQPSDLPETIIAKQDETLVSKNKSEEAKFVEKKRFEPERRRASGLEHIGLGPMEPPRRIQEKRPVSRDTVSPDVKVLSVSRKAPSIIRPPVQLPKPAQSAKQPIDLLETIIAKQDETLASNIGLGPMEPPRRIQEKRPISRDTVSPDVKVLSVSRKAPSVIRPPVPLPKPAQSAKQPIDLLETIIAKQDETLASKYKSEKVKFEEKTRFELERRRASGLEHIGFGPMEPPRRIQEKRPISKTSLASQKHPNQIQEMGPPVIEEEPLPDDEADEDADGEPPGPPKPTETSLASQARALSEASKVLKNSEEMNQSDVDNQEQLNQYEQVLDAEPEASSTEEQEKPPAESQNETMSDGEEEEDDDDENGEQEKSFPDFHDGPVPDDEDDALFEIPAGSRPLIKREMGPPVIEEDPLPDDEADENENGEPTGTPKPTETSQKLLNQPEQMLLKDPKGLLSRASEVLKKMNESDVDNQEQLNQYEQVLDAEPEASSPEEQEKPLPDFHGEPVPDDEDDDDALFEIAAGLRPLKKREMGPPVIEEEPLADDDFIELDYYNADLNIKAANNNKWLIDPDNGDGFALMWGGVRSNYGIILSDDFLPAEKVAFQIKIVEFLSLKHVPFEEMEPHDVRIGWSANGTSNMLGESAHSYAFCSLGKKAHANHFEEYGEAFHAGDVVTTVLDLNNCEIRFYKNKMNLGTAFIDLDFKSGDVVFPHIATKNCKVLVNFGGEEEELPETEDLTLWSLPPEEADSTMVARLRNAGRDGIVASRRPPPDKTSCTVIAMVGLPGAGKTTWVRQYLRDHPEEHWILLNTDTILSAMTLNGVPRRRAHTGRWDMVMGLTSKALTRSLQLACRRRHNYIIDKTNVSKEARKKLAQFADFQRKCVVIIPSDEELERRLIKQSRLDGGASQTPAEAMLELKAMFSIPCTETEPVEDVKFIEPPISRINEAIELVKKYNEEGKPWMRQPYGRTKKPESVISDHRDMPNQWVAGRPSI